MKHKTWKRLASIALSLALALEIAVLADILLVFFGLRLTPVQFAALLGALFVGTLACRFLTVKRKMVLCTAVPAAVAALSLGCFAVWYGFRGDGAYVVPDAGKEALYGGRSVMVIVPHEDDEINILGGVTEAFTRYGSTVRVVYVTNGDQGGMVEKRLEEAIAYCESVGVPEEQVIFLGYGDCWSAETGVHIYNAASGQVLTSYIGRTRTYGLEDHPAYRDGVDYTVDNMLADLENVILEFRPDILFCTDYDDHIDHKSLTFSFEKVMGKLLRENPDYQPVVLKGYAYTAAWFAEADYYKSINVLSTRNVFQEPHNQHPEVYRWEERLRFPVAGETLSRALVDSDAYQGLKRYASQAAHSRAVSVVNGDRVFWQRRTDSLCIPGSVTVSSGDGSLLNNFMLLDNVDIWEKKEPYDGVWIPDEEDYQKQATVDFGCNAFLESIVLYDHPAEDRNVCNAVIEFNDGTKLETGALNPSGSATRISVGKDNVSGFTVRLVQWEGEDAGLAEIEAYSEPGQGNLPFVKLMDVDGNFVYDYCIEHGDSVTWKLYVQGDGLNADLTQYAIRTSNESLNLTSTESALTIRCPVGESGVLTLLDEETGLSDSVFIRNPGAGKLVQWKLGQLIEDCAVFRFRESIVFRIGKRVLSMLDMFW